jgi:hypothetical protein
MKAFKTGVNAGKVPRSVQKNPAKQLPPKMFYRTPDNVPSNADASAPSRTIPGKKQSFRKPNPRPNVRWESSLS